MPVELIMADARHPFPRPASRRFGRDRAGVAAIEFAFILPIMLTLWAGLAETANAIDNWRKVTSLARTVADLTSQGDGNATITTPDMNDILAASTALLRPFSSTSVTIVVSALEVNTKTSPLHPTICSSVSTGNNASARKTGTASDLPIPPGFANNQRYILAEVSMPYTPMIGTSATKLVGGKSGSITLNSSFPWPTRGGQSYNNNYFPEVILPGGAQCP